MRMKGLGLGGWLAVVALVGCGSSGNSTGTGGNSGTGGTGTTGHAGSTGTAGNGSAGHAGGGGATGAGGAFTTSVSSGTKLTGLTSAQQTQLCSDVENFVDHTFFPELCAAAAAGSVDGLTAAYLDLLGNSGATDAQLRADCTTAVADAGANASACVNSVLDAGTQSCDISSIPAACQATVGDYTKCLDDETTASVLFYAGFPSCSTITAASLNALFAADGGIGEGAPVPPSCAVFDTGGACNTDEAGTNDSPKMPLRAAAMARAFRK